MGKTFSVLGRKSKPGFRKEKPKNAKQKQLVRVTAKRRSADRQPAAQVRPRAKRTLYEDTIHIEKKAGETGESTVSIKAIRDAKKHRSRVVWGVFIAVLVTALVVGIAVGCMVLFFKVGRIECKGITMYPEDEVIAFTGITPGQQLYGIDRDAIASQLCARYPYLRDVRITREIPDGIVISAQEDTAAYIASIGGHYYVLSPGLRVLETFDEKEPAYEAHTGMIELTLPRVSRAIVGEELAYFNARDEKYITAVLEVLLNGEHASGVRRIDLSSKFDLSFNYEARIDILLGDTQDIPAKIRFAFAIMDQLDPNAVGTISAENVESGYALIE